MPYRDALEDAATLLWGEQWYLGLTTGAKAPLPQASNTENTEGLVDSSQNLVESNTDVVIHHNTRYIFHQSLPENILKLLPNTGLSSNVVYSIGKQTHALKLLSEVLMQSLPEGAPKPIVQWRSPDQMNAAVQLLASYKYVQDISIILPTGAGKTMLPLILSNYRKKLQREEVNTIQENRCEVLVIPLIGLGLNLKNRLQQRGYNVQFLRSLDEVKHFTAYREAQILLMTPEMFLKHFITLKDMSINGTLGWIWWDESHCIVIHSTFRKAYSEAAEKSAHLGVTRVFMSATVPLSIETSLQELAKATSMTTFRFATNRLNIHHFRCKVDNSFECGIVNEVCEEETFRGVHAYILSICKEVEALCTDSKGRILVYFMTINEAEKGYKILQKLTIDLISNNILCKAVLFHGSLLEHEKEERFRDLTNYTGFTFISCTSALLMGNVEIFAFVLL